MKTTVDRKIAITTGIICILLAISLVGAIANYTSIINAKNNTINTLNLQIDNLTAQTENQSGIIALQSTQITSMNKEIQNLTNQIDQLNNNITALNAQNTEFQSQIDNLTSQVNILQTKVNASNAQIETLENQAATDQFTTDSLRNQLATANTQTAESNTKATTLQTQVDKLRGILNLEVNNLQTLVFHVSEKGEGYIWGHLPDANDTYNQIQALNNNRYNILLMPEYKGNKNWTEELAWITANFGGQHGIPIMLPIFGGGNGTIPDYQLDTTQILAAMAVANVRWIAIGEIVSWYMEHPELPFPTQYITSILEFCQANNLKLFWTEWKAETFKTIQTYIKGYEDTVTASFSTNSGDLEPADGFMQINQMFQHWGASIQAWYWTTRHNESDPLNMPTSLLIQHALSAKNTGAEIIEFEPYWYFFDNGQANENLKTLEIMLT